MRLRDGFHGQVAIALFDILGFRDLVRSTSLERLREIVSSVDDAAAVARVSTDHIGSMVLSDTIILYSGPDQGALAAAMITISASNLLNIFARRRIPLRGALTYGELYVEPRLNRMAGRALVAAYELEKQQEWAGAVVDPNADEFFRASMANSPVPENLVTYCPPMKNGNRDMRQCVNWVHRYEPFSRDVKQIFGAAADSSHDVYRKYIGTQAFFDRFSTVV